MMNNNKILTVSYGTFSCTLEGFDDSFDTMKAIAEYFRDLAADDRYFGAEPPQPDAEMLAKIAEREVAGRVEASEHDGRIMLKAHDDAADTMQAAPLAAPLAASFEEESEDVTDPTPVQEVTEVQATPDEDEISDDAALDEDSAAAFFANSPSVEDALEENEGTEEISVEAFTGYIAAGAAEAADADEDIVADETGDTAEAATMPFEYEEQDEPSSDAEENSNEMEIQASGADENENELIINQVEPESQSIFAAENFAEKLQRIRDVVSRPDSVDEDADDDMLDETRDTLSAIPAFETDDAGEKAVAASPFVEDAADDIETALMQEDDLTPSDSSDEGDELDQILSRIDADAAQDDDDMSDISPAATVASENIFGVQDIASDETEAEADEEETEDVSVDGRILKVNRSALDAALENGELEEYTEEDIEETSFSEVQEQELKDNLAALKMVAADEEGDDTNRKSSARENLPEIDETAGNDVSRLMAEADHQMDEPEGKTRRSAFAHLRAAVAARFADRSMDKDAEAEEEKEAEAYRSDLASVVKPRRPSNASDQDKRDTAERPSPLKLVAEQRIDAEEAGLIDPVAPRRVAAGVAEELILEEDTDFAGYADDLGANTLPEVLEAAAAYLCHVEGVEEFSRPQLMSRVKQADCGDFTREDGLRAFGQLLRTGKIEKIRGGRFVASDAIGFKPGHRAAG